MAQRRSSPSKSKAKAAGTAKASPKAERVAHGEAIPHEGEVASRGQWGSRIGFILAAMGSAIGFGSIARFPMNVANNGGAVFVILYGAIMLLVGVPMMIAEFSLGRSAQSNTVGVFKRLTGNPKTGWRGVGVLYFLIAAFFLSWYAVVSGWMLRAGFASITGSYFDDPGTFFGDVLEGGDALVWHFAVLLLTGIVVVRGISAGIEKLNLFLMPTLFLIIVGLAVYAFFLDNAFQGYAFYLNPDFSAISLAVVTAAVGQAFFSLSLAEGAMMTYASYLPKEASLATNALSISISTLVFATISGFMIFPMLAAFDLLGGGQAGLALILGPLPQAFAGMGMPIGNIVGSFFFFGTFFAAFTSAVSLTEPAIAFIAEEYGIARRKAAIFVVLAIYTAGIIPAFSQEVLNVEGGAITDMLVMVGGLLLAIFVGWVLPKRQAMDQMDSGKGLRLGWYVYPIVRFVMPAVLSVLLFFIFAGTPCVLTGLDAAGNEVANQGLLEQWFGLGLTGCDPPPAAGA